jgi:hypothetical protein
MSDNEKPPTLLQQAVQTVDEQEVDGVAAGILLRDGALGAEATVKVDVGQPGGWGAGATWRWLQKQGHSAAAFVRWTPKP